MFGPHVNRYHAAGARPPMAAHVAAAVAEAADGAGFRVDAVAFYVSEPRAMAINLSPAERAPLRALLGSYRAYVHSAYRAWPWGGDPATARFIREELKVCSEIGARGLVVHLPKAPAELVLKYAPQLLEPTAAGVRIYFETPAVVPKESYYDSPAKLARLFAALRSIDPDLDRFGLCVDTSHLWVNGNDLQSYESAKAWFDGLAAAAAVIPPHCIMLHLNDSATARGHGPDEHAALARGRIWSGHAADLAKSGLAAVVDYAAANGIPAILERKPKELLQHDYRLLLQLAPESAVGFKRGGGPPKDMQFEWELYDGLIDEASEATGAEPGSTEDGPASCGCSH